MVLTAMNTSLIPIFLDLVPIAVIAVIALLFIHEKPLATAIHREIPAESLAEGQLVVTDPALDADAVGSSFEAVPTRRASGGRAE